MAFHPYSSQSYVRMVPKEFLQEIAISWFSYADSLSDKFSLPEPEDPHTLPNLINAYSILQELQTSMPQDHICYVYFCKKRAAGIALLTMHEQELEIDYFCVNPTLIAYKTVKGVGKRFLIHIAELAARIGKPSVFVVPDKESIEFCTKQGFLEREGEYTLAINASPRPIELSAKTLALPKGEAFIVPKDRYGRLCEDLDEAGDLELAEKIHKLKHMASDIIVIGIQDKDGDFIGACLIDVEDPGKLVITDIVSVDNNLVDYVENLGRESERKVSFKQEPNQFIPKKRNRLSKK